MPKTIDARQASEPKKAEKSKRIPTRRATSTRQVSPFSASILAGLAARHVPAAEVQRIAKLTPVEFQEVLDGSRALKLRQIRLIEGETGYSGGQLAALTLEPDGGPLTDMMNLSAGVRFGEGAKSAIGA